MVLLTSSPPEYWVRFGHSQKGTPENILTLILSLRKEEHETQHSYTGTFSVTCVPV